MGQNSLSQPDNMCHVQTELVGEGGFMMNRKEEAFVTELLAAKDAEINALKSGGPTGVALEAERTPENLAEAIRIFGAHAEAGHFVIGAYASMLKRALDQAIALANITTGVEEIKPWDKRCAVYANGMFCDTSGDLYDYIEAMKISGTDQPGLGGETK